MSISSVDIQEQGFGTARNGYDMQEVDIFLEHVAREIDQMKADYEDALAEAHRQAAAASGPTPEQEEENRRLREAVAQLQRKLNDSHTDEAVISEAFIAAQKSANAIKGDARAEAEKVISDAKAKADEIVGEAANEKQRIIDEIERLDKSRTEFVDEYSTLIKHFSDEATKVFTRSGLNESVRASHEPKKSFGAAPSPADAAVVQSEPVPFAEPAPDTNETVFGEVAVSFDDDLD